MIQFFCCLIIWKMKDWHSLSNTLTQINTASQALYPSLDITFHSLIHLAIYVPPLSLSYCLPPLFCLSFSLSLICFHILTHLTPLSILLSLYSPLYQFSFMYFIRSISLYCSPNLKLVLVVNVWVCASTEKLWNELESTKEPNWLQRWNNKKTVTFFLIFRRSLSRSKAGFRRERRWRRPQHRTQTTGPGTSL